MEKFPNDTIAVNDTITFTCYADDIDGDPLTFKWSVSEWYQQFGRFIEDEANPARWVADSLLYLDDRYWPMPLRVIIEDSWGFTDVHDDSFYVVPRDSIITGGSAPVINRLRAERDTIAPLDTMQVFIDISDEDDALEELSVEWFYSGGYLIEQDESGIMWMSPNDRGRYKIAVEVSDRTASTRDSIYVVVANSGSFNSPPAIERVYAVNPRIVVNGQTQVICDAFDDDDDELDYTWTSENGRFVGGGPRVDWVAPSIIGVYRINVDVSDGTFITRGVTHINVAPDTIIYFNSDFSHNDVTGLWSYDGLLAGLGTFQPNNTVAWDSLLQKMKITSHSDYSTSAFRMQQYTFLDGTFRITAEATNTQFIWLGFLPKYLGPSNYFFIGINFFQQTCEVIRCLNGTLEYLARYDAGGFTANHPYEIVYTQADGNATVRVNDVQIWSNTVADLFKNSATSVGVGVYGLVDSGTAYYDNIRITYP